MPDGKLFNTRLLAECQIKILISFISTLFTLLILCIKVDVNVIKIRLTFVFLSFFSRQKSISWITSNAPWMLSWSGRSWNGGRSSRSLPTNTMPRSPKNSAEDGNSFPKVCENRTSTRQSDCESCIKKSTRTTSTSRGRRPSHRQPRPPPPLLPPAFLRWVLSLETSRRRLPSFDAPVRSPAATSGDWRSNSCRPWWTASWRRTARTSASSCLLRWRLHTTTTTTNNNSNLRFSTRLLRPQLYSWEQCPRLIIKVISISFSIRIWICF